MKETGLSAEETVVGMLTEKGLTVATAESCTGGLLAGTIINVPGASDVIGTGFVTYSNDAKKECLGVKKRTLKKFGAVSCECAKEMAKGAAHRAGADIGLSTTGIAGPGGGTDEKPVGLVYIGCSFGKKVKVRKCLFGGTREQIRKKAVAAALGLLQKCVKDE